MSRDRVTADETVGRLLSWLTGRKSIENADSPTSAAVGTFVSWLAGKPKRRHRRSRRRWRRINLPGAWIRGF